MGDRQISESRVIDAAPSTIFDMLADPARHPEIDGSGSVKAVRGEPQRLKLGSQFSMDMKLLLVAYPIVNRVVEFEENKLIAWRHFNGHRWRWQLHDLGNGRTEVTETFDYSTALVPIALEWLGFPEKNRDGIVKTLDRLQEKFKKES